MKNIEILLFCKEAIFENAPGTPAGFILAMQARA
jgi:hypothetical protein